MVEPGSLIIRTALNVDGYRNTVFSPITSGLDRKEQYKSGICSILKLVTLEKFSRVLLVDNTISHISEISADIRELLPKEWEIVVTKSNHYGRSNKGAGDIETYKTLELGGYLSGYIFHHEARLLLRNPKLINSFASKPENSICQEIPKPYSLRLISNKTVATGHFGIHSKLLSAFVNKVDLPDMVRLNHSIERLLWIFLKQNHVKMNPKAGYCERFNPTRLKYEEY
jgi:hypothetical protein